MKKVLVIAYYFPPMGMGGVQRALKFVKYLPEYGWEPIVLTVRETAYYADDPSLLQDVRTVPIFRTESLDPLRLLRKNSGISNRYIAPQSRNEKINRRLQPWFFIPDSKVLWLPFAARTANSIMHSLNPDLVLTTSPPHSVHLLGLWLKHKGVPWVADFRDHWLAESYENVPTPLHRSLNRFLLKHVINKADRVLAISKPILDDLAKHTGKVEKFSMIPNGFDRADFDAVKPESLKKFIISYCGTLSPIRKPDVFLLAAAKAIQIKPELAVSLRIRFVGSIYGYDLPSLVNRLGLDNQVEIVGYVSHGESIRHLMQADLLLLLISGDSSEGVVTGKLYEYLAAGKPILAVVPAGVAERLVLSHARGSVVHPEDIEGLTGQILRAFDLWKRDDLRVTRPRWEGLDDLDRKNQTCRLAQIFNQVKMESKT